MQLRKFYLLILAFIASSVSFSQTKNKEIAYVIFDNQSDTENLIEDGTGNLQSVKTFRKSLKREKIIFQIGNEKFLFSTRKNIDTVNSIANIDLRKIEYLKQKYQRGNDFKHHVFEKVFILEKISDKTFLKYDVYWCCEWSIE